MGKVFKKDIVGGFNKKQVIDYIDALVEKHKDALVEEDEKRKLLQEEIDRLTKELDDNVENANQEQAEEIELLKSNIEAEKAANKELSEQVGQLMAELEIVKYANEQQDNEQSNLLARYEEASKERGDLYAQLAEKDKQIKELKERNFELAGAVESSREKSGIYELTALKLAEANAALENARARCAQLEQQLKNAAPAQVQPTVEECDRSDEAWLSIKNRINDLATDLEDLVKDVNTADSKAKANKAMTVKEILEKVRKIGEKI